MAVSNPHKLGSDGMANVHSTPHQKKFVALDDTLDSGCISPPTQVTYELATPHPYNLRQPVRWSSTPLPLLGAQAGSGATPALVKAASSPIFSNVVSGPPIVEIVDFRKRLEVLDQQQDSGYDSLLSEINESKSPRESDSSTQKNDTSLGAIPKRRSPRHKVLTRNLDVERLGRLKFREEDRREDEPEPFLHPARWRAAPERPSREGRENYDIIRHLAEMGLSHVLSQVYSHLSSADLCKVAQVSHLWRLSLQASSSHEDRRLQHLAKMKIERENFGHKENSVPKRISPRRVFREMVNLRSQVSPTAAKRDRNPSTSTPALVSPSKIRHKLFVDEARKLDKGERLVKCPLCTSPSRVSLTNSAPALTDETAECSSPKCQFLFCPKCQCKDHPGRACVPTSSKSSKSSGGVASKKSKARLRRL